MGKTDNKHTGQMHLACNMVTSAKEKNRAERDMGLSGIVVKVRTVKEDLAEKLTFFQRLGGDMGGDMGVLEEHSRQREQ